MLCPSLRISLVRISRCCASLAGPLAAGPLDAAVPLSLGLSCCLLLRLLLHLSPCLCMLCLSLRLRLSDFCYHQFGCLILVVQPVGPIGNPAIISLLPDLCGATSRSHWPPRASRTDDCVAIQFSPVLVCHRVFCNATSLSHWLLCRSSRLRFHGIPCCAIINPPQDFL